MKVEMKQRMPDGSVRVVVLEKRDAFPSQNLAGLFDCEKDAKTALIMDMVALVSLMNPQSIEGDTGGRMPCIAKAFNKRSGTFCKSGVTPMSSERVATMVYRAERDTDPSNR